MSNSFDAEKAFAVYSLSRAGLHHNNQVMRTRKTGFYPYWIGCSTAKYCKRDGLDVDLS